MVKMKTETNERIKHAINAYLSVEQPPPLDLSLNHIKPFFERFDFTFTYNNRTKETVKTAYTNQYGDSLADMVNAFSVAIKSKQQQQQGKPRFGKENVKPLSTTRPSVGNRAKEHVALSSAIRKTTAICKRFDDYSCYTSISTNFSHFFTVSFNIERALKKLRRKYRMPKVHFKVYNSKLKRLKFVARKSM